MNKQNQQIIKNLNNTYAQLKPSKIQGVGAFAIRDIPKGKKIFEGQINQKWYKIKKQEIKNLDKEIQKMIKDFFVEENGYFHIPRSGLNAMDASFYVNHSKKPNLKTIDDGFTFVAKRKIKKNEELTVDYSTYE